MPDTDTTATEDFTGTVPAFLEWLQETLQYGGITISEPRPDEYSAQADRLVRDICLITAGFSDDEHLLGRVANKSMFSFRFWESTHRGGLTVYRVPVEVYESPEELLWLDPADDVINEVWRARTLIIDTGHSSRLTFALPAGARLRFSEPDRTICSPDGVLTLEQIPVAEIPNVFKTVEATATNEPGTDELIELLGD